PSRSWGCSAAAALPLRFSTPPSGRIATSRASTRRREPAVDSDRVRVSKVVGSIVPPRDGVFPAHWPGGRIACAGRPAASTETPASYGAVPPADTHNTVTTP